MAVSKFPYDLPAPRSWATQVYRKLIYWHDLDRGGHFASLEEPEKFVQELRDFARSLRQI
jgi:pimeloyl-ACP methyl ester carboxylesterase